MASFEVPQPESAGFGVSDLMHHIELPESGQLLAVLDATCTNVRVSIGNLPDWMNLLCVIHDRFRDCMAVKVTTEIDVVPLLLARLSYDDWVASVMLVLSGQLPAAYASMRPALESAVLALHCSCSLELQEIWLKRNESRGDFKRSRTSFAWCELLKSLQENRCRELGLVGCPRSGRPCGGLVQCLYDKLNDAGAHANAYSVLSTVGSGADGWNVEQFRCGDVTMRVALKTVAYTGCVTANAIRGAIRLEPMPGRLLEWVDDVSRVTLPGEPTTETLQTCVPHTG